MIASIILVFSLATLTEFFVAYCRSLIASTSEHVLSDQTRKLAEVAGNRVAPENFATVMRLVKLCPQLAGRSQRVRAVAAYFRLMTLLAAASRTLGLGMTDWADGERAGCAFYAAVALDRRIAHNRELFAAEISNPS